MKLFTECVVQDVDALKGLTPYPIPYDYVEGNTNDLYLNRYGNSWEEQIKKVSRSGLPLVQCVTDLIEHINRITKEAYKDTPFKDTYFWSHDVLKQMCDPTCQAWIKEKGYRKHWIVPVLECNKEVSMFCPEKYKTITSKHYTDRPIGNQPELMPLDASLNWDIYCSLNMHVLLTAELPNDHPNKFRRDIPN